MPSIPRLLRALGIGEEMGLADFIPRRMQERLREEPMLRGSITSGGHGPRGTPLTGQPRPPSTPTQYVDDIPDRLPAKAGNEFLVNSKISGTTYQDQRTEYGERGIQSHRGGTYNRIWNAQSKKNRAKKDRSGLASLMMLLAAGGVGAGGLGALLMRRKRELEEQAAMEADYREQIDPLEEEEFMPLEAPAVSSFKSSAMMR